MSSITNLKKLFVPQNFDISYYKSSEKKIVKIKLTKKTTINLSNIFVSFDNFDQSLQSAAKFESISLPDGTASNWAVGDKIYDAEKVYFYKYAQKSKSDKTMVMHLLGQTAF